MSKLVIVESPTKAKTIARYLDKEHRVLSSRGHVRDLPKTELGVEIDKNFAPKFVTVQGIHITKLKKSAKQADEIILATDHDREGEAIAYDLFEVLRKAAPKETSFRRLVFNEITERAIQAALSKTEEIDTNKVEAQRTRRVLDRLVGYLASPLLSKALTGNQYEGLSAGRVQSVALRFISDREAEIEQFIAQEYWEIIASLRNGKPFSAKLTRRDGKKIKISTAAEAEKIKRDLQQAQIVVETVTEQQRRVHPQPPFITSSLQQAAASNLGFSPNKTMKIAQELYEGVTIAGETTGIITYMRTDSVRVSTAALSEARAYIKDQFEEEYLSKTARHYKNKRKAQDAHEAIRPTSPARSPEQIASFLSPDQLKLYKLIFARFLATQMTPAIYLQRKGVISADQYTLEVTGSNLLFDGFQKAFTQFTLETSKIDGKEKAEPLFPIWLKEGDSLLLEKVEAMQKFTEPPRRFTEAGLVRLLEQSGIGRPSTYASIVSTIQDRNYVIKEKGSLRPTLLGRVVADFLEEHIPETVAIAFTAHMEEDLDLIEAGEMDRVTALKEFYEPFSRQIEKLNGLFDQQGKPFQIFTDSLCPKCNGPMELRYWKGTHFLGCSNYPQCKTTQNLPPSLDYRYAEKKVEVLSVLEKLDNKPPTEIICPKCGAQMALHHGRYGRYLRCVNSQCKETLSVSTGILCPKCGAGEIVEKYSSKRKEVFYGCNTYPACKFAVSDMPVKICPDCRQGVLVKKGDVLKCSNKMCAETVDL
ncbi:type I DNA topoisomerase [Candidatus Acetothermia bacterium]|nr:type I DNA topoisomerase [Candidatus Acetothermia bacterium]